MILVYTLDRERVHAMVDARVSQTAAREYADDGTSLYDSIVVPSNERPRIEDSMLAALSALVLRNAEEAWEGTDDGGDATVSFAVPDFPEDRQERVRELTDAYVADTCCALWMRRVRPDREKEYADSARTGLDTLSALIHTRKRPQRKGNGD